MNAAQFRKIALSLPEAVEESHQGHPDFRIRKKIFATLGPDEDWGVVKLTPETQADFMHTDPKSFAPSSGAWGERGYTKITLKSAKVATVRPAVVEAWRNTAPPKLLEQFDDEN